jgi:hypothetical protein
MAAEYLTVGEARSAKKLLDRCALPLAPSLAQTPVEQLENIMI